MITTIKTKDSTYAEALTAQAQTISAALLALSGQCDGAKENDGVGFNGVDASFGNSLADVVARGKALTPRQQRQAWEMCRKYWRQLKKAGITLPKKWTNVYQVDADLVCHNLSKGSAYQLTQIGDDAWTCECEAAQNGQTCGHIRFIQANLTSICPPCAGHVARAGLKQSLKLDEVGQGDVSHPPDSDQRSRGAWPAYPAQDEKLWVDDTDPAAALEIVMGNEVDSEVDYREYLAEDLYQHLDRLWELGEVSGSAYDAARQAITDWVEKGGTHPNIDAIISQSTPENTACVARAGHAPLDQPLESESGCQTDIPHTPRSNEGIGPAQPARAAQGAEVEMLPGIFATPGQVQALDDLMAFAQGSHSMHLLTGYAGTGKSTVIQAWLKRLRNEGYRGSIVFTAPTNKATEVLRKMVSQWGLGVDCLTCAKLLGLRPEINQETGKEDFVKAYGEDSAIQNYDIVVIDECSMVSESLWDYLAEEANLLTRLLFVGDYAQLPPVGEAISRSFTAIPPANRSNLSEVKRYRGSIASLADAIRRTQHLPVPPAFESEFTENGSEGVWRMDVNGWANAMLRAFRSDKYRDDPDFARAVAWTNRRVGEINRFVRADICGANAPRFVVGERLLACGHYGVQDALGKGKTILNTSAEMEVLDVLEGKTGTYDAWFLTVEIFSGDIDQAMIPVLHERSKPAFDARLKELKKEKRWREYYHLLKGFAQVDYAYAMTVHKSQGSTWQNVWVDASDILRDSSKAEVTLPTGETQLVYERNQLLYVALTRTAKRLFVLG